MKTPIWSYNIGIESGRSIFTSCFQDDLLLKMKHFIDLGWFKQKVSGSKAHSFVVSSKE